MTFKVIIKNQLPLDVLESQIKNLNMKRSLSGQIMVFDHIDIDIVLDEKDLMFLGQSKHLTQTIRDKAI